MEIIASEISGNVNFICFVGTSTAKTNLSGSSAQRNSQTPVSISQLWTRFLRRNSKARLAWIIKKNRLCSNIRTVTILHHRCQRASLCRYEGQLFK